MNSCILKQTNNHDAKMIKNLTNIIISHLPAIITVFIAVAD